MIRLESLMHAGCGRLAAMLILPAMSLTLAVGCRQSGPPNTTGNSAQFANVQQRIDFLNKYVTFRRTYESLDFDIRYINGSSGTLPAPSECDIRLVATVPASELPLWIPPGVKPLATPADRKWLDSVPTTLDLSGLSEWYEDGSRTVGIDRQRRIVAYRNQAM